jgi:SnoaL-like domain
MSILSDEAVRSVITRLLHAVDARQWSVLPALFTDDVTTDFTSLFGGEAEWQRADALIDNWQRLLTPLDATQHLLGPIDVRVQGPLALAECHVRAYHVAEAAAGGKEWMVSGHYVFELLDDGGVWKVAKLTLQTFYQTGNRQLLSQLAGAG